MSHKELPEGIRALAELFDGKLGQPGALRRPKVISIAIICIVATLFFWMLVAPIDRVVRANGRVVPSGKNQLVQHLEGGVVAAIHVKEGERVEAGKLLVEIGDTLADSEVQERRLRSAALKAKVVRLTAEAEGAANMPPLDEDTPDAKMHWDMEYAAFLARKSRLQQQVAVHQAQLSQHREEIRELTARRTSLREEKRIAEKQLDTMQSLQKRRAASELELLEAQARLQRLVTQIAEVEHRIPQVEAMIRESSERVASEIAAFRAEARAELSASSTDARSLGQELRARADRLTRTELRAPVGGIVNRVLVTTIGGVVRPGESVVEIVPIDQKIVIEGQVLPSDRAQLHEGLPAVVKIGAYDYTLYGTLRARVREISADTLADERGNRFYRTLLIVDEASAKQFNQPVLPGMTATADIVIGERTVASYLLSSVLRFSSTAMRDNH